MATTADIKNGMCIELNGKTFSVVEFLHVKPGKGPAFVRTKLKNLENGPQRQDIISRMNRILQDDAPWIFGFYPKSYTLRHSWLHNRKPSDVGRNGLKYQCLDLAERVGLHKVNYAVGFTAWMDINPEGVSKASALEQVRRRLRVEPGDTVAVVGVGGIGINAVRGQGQRPHRAGAGPEAERPLHSTTL